MEVCGLLVEDVSDARLPAQSNKDFFVATVSDEENILRLLKTIRPNAIIIDLTIPGLDGPDPASGGPKRWRLTKTA